MPRQTAKPFLRFHSNMGLIEFILFAVILGRGLAYELFDEEKRQQLYPFPRIGRSFWDLIEEKRLGGLMPFPRVGRTDGKRQGLIPFPRIGRSVDNDYDSDEFMMDDGYYDLPKTFLKRAGKARFTPRIGRKKRSIHQEEDAQPDPAPNHTTNIHRVLVPWPMQTDSEYDDNTMFYSPNFIRADRAMFKPRIGKKNHQYDSDYQKRALIPRIGRPDPSIQTRAAFQPRIGRALVPRVGRSKTSEMVKA